ncbi:MAG: hypothetical protein AB7F22_17040 [Reyranella sp.]|uniref:hypothetical protein n=1 Tax=Reyranella sp. TaxID=1929291 RepID=UPI003D118A18
MMVRRRLLLVVPLLCPLLGVMPALGQPTDTRLAFYFRPEPRSTIAYDVTEGEKSWGGAKLRSYLKWRHTLTLALGEPDGEVWPATLTISDIRIEEGEGSSLFLTLARIAEGRPRAVRLDRRGGFVQEVVDWPNVKAELKRALSTRISADEALLMPDVLDRLDVVRGANAFGPTLSLISGGYAMGMRPDGAPVTSENWQGGSAYVLPAGRTLTSRLAGYDRTSGIAAVDWSIATDPAVAARHLGPEFRSLLAGGSGPDVARARSELEKALAGGAVALEENGQVAYEMRRRFITRYGSRLKIEVGPFRKERGIFAKAM